MSATRWGFWIGVYAVATIADYAIRRAARRGER